MLQGSLDNFELGDVLGLLEDTHQTGRLRVTGDRGTGSLWLVDGTLVAGIVGLRTDTSLEEILFELLRFESGEFSFAAEERSVEGSGERAAVATVVEGARARLEEWRSIEAVVPSLAHVAYPVPDLPEANVTLTNVEWQVVVAVAPSATIDTICTALGMGEVDGSREVRNLVERGLLEVVAPSAPVEPLATRDDRLDERGLAIVEEVADEPYPQGEYDLSRLPSVSGDVTPDRPEPTLAVQEPSDVRPSRSAVSDERFEPTGDADTDPTHAPEDGGDSAIFGSSGTAPDLGRPEPGERRRPVGRRSAPVSAEDAVAESIAPFAPRPRRLPQRGGDGSSMAAAAPGAAGLPTDPAVSGFGDSWSDSSLAVLDDAGRTAPSTAPVDWPETGGAESGVANGVHAAEVATPTPSDAIGAASPFDAAGAAAEPDGAASWPGLATEPMPAPTSGLVAEQAPVADPRSFGASGPLADRASLSAQPPVADPTPFGAAGPLADPAPLSAQAPVADPTPFGAAGLLSDPKSSADPGLLSDPKLLADSATQPASDPFAPRRRASDPSSLLAGREDSSPPAEAAQSLEDRFRQIDGLAPAESGSGARQAPNPFDAPPLRLEDPGFEVPPPPPPPPPGYQPSNPALPADPFGGGVSPGAASPFSGAGFDAASPFDGAGFDADATGPISADDADQDADLEGFVDDDESGGGLLMQYLRRER